MQINDLFHGFRVQSCENIPEIKTRLWRMVFEKNGAELVWLERPDDNDNKTFGIAFRTVPDDDTGVFHILEHSVLCGSEKFPVREPFVELIKSSVNTFLNAMTYPDKTVYPISSRNARDFLNLMEVYLDAVFCPLCVKSPTTFHQEGWHWETGEGDEPEKVTCNGVVYSEMKGAFASPERSLSTMLQRLLFPDTCYGYVSGGDPAHIPELTYERFLEGHRRFYSASNSRIFLDGIFEDNDAVFGLIESYLDRYDRIDVDSEIAYQAPVCPPEAVGYYAIGADEEADGKVLYSEGYVFSDYSEKEKNLAAALLTDLLCDSNEAPVKRAVLEKELCEDISIYVSDGILQNKIVVSVKNTTEENIPEIKKTVSDVINGMIENGIDADRLEAILNSTEFSMREQDYGRTPKGLAFGLATLDSWLYGGNPADPLKVEEILSSLRKKLRDGSRYYENLLKEIFTDCKHKAACRMLPSKTLTEETAAAEAERCAAAGKSWSEAERRKVLDDLAELRRAQGSPDSPAALATLPKLRLSDITEVPHASRETVSSLDGVTVLRHPQNTNGIVYSDIYFDIGDFTADELIYAALVDELFLELPTSSHSAIEMQDLVKRDLGGLTTGIDTYPAPRKAGTYRIVFSVSASALASKRDRIIAIAPEAMLTADYSGIREIVNILKQTVLYLERSVAMGGNRFAARRASAMLSESAYIDELLNGIEFLKRIRAIVAEAEADGGKALAGKLSATAKRIFVKERAVIAVAGDTPDAWIEELIGALPHGDAAGKKASVGTLEKVSEGIEIPAQIGFAGLAGRFDSSYDYTAGTVVATHFVSYDWLWNEVRVKGGAYGCGLSVGASGSVSFTSYRDPQPASSLDAFAKSAGKLRALADEGPEAIEKYIISSLPAADPMLTPASEMSRDVSLYFRGLPADFPIKAREEILAVNPDTLRKAADMLDDVIANSSAVVVVGGSKVLEACGDRLQKISPLK
ncbi:MAG: insulinase family protein [Clostridia bacterium]|nr:insulinase family protein [Clostridia bacterium]